MYGVQDCHELVGASSHALVSSSSVAASALSWHCPHVSRHQHCPMSAKTSRSMNAARVACVRHMVRCANGAQWWMCRLVVRRRAGVGCRRAELCGGTALRSGWRACVCVACMRACERERLGGVRASVCACVREREAGWRQVSTAHELVGRMRTGRELIMDVPTCVRDVMARGVRLRLRETWRLGLCLVSGHVRVVAPASRVLHTCTIAKHAGRSLYIATNF